MSPNVLRSNVLIYCIVSNISSKVILYLRNDKSNYSHSWEYKRKMM